MSDKSMVAEPLVMVRDATRYFGTPRRRLHAIDGVDLDVFPRETVALVGESGSGKTTLARLILKLTEISSGKIVVDGMDLSTISGPALRRFRRSAQIVFQDPYSSLDPRLTVGAIVTEGIEHLPAPERRLRVSDILNKVGLQPNVSDRFPHQLSGGQRQRVGIARALAVQPKFLVLDEPVSALDVSMQAQVLNLLMTLREELGLTYLVISHDMSVVRHMADRTAVMYMGKIVEVAPTTRLFEAPEHPYTQALLSAVPTVGPHQGRRLPIVLPGDPPSPINPPNYCRFAARCFRVNRDQCQKQLPRLEAKEDPLHLAACFFPGPLAKTENPCWESKSKEDIL